MPEEIDKLNLKEKGGKKNVTNIDANVQVSRSEHMPSKLRDHFPDSTIIWDRIRDRPR